MSSWVGTGVEKETQINLTPLRIVERAEGSLEGVQDIQISSNKQ